eukprot:TRINITY_DN3127_c0_g1_i1.p1 TRINITY_DN3127_c0_g1~~TRINITY_DN3127_c0_g1_i1.p1  ORF type:complete len:376 (+),score=56.84 TRINITY_DN3127_c0_g1_i1:55-1182(+)
MKRNEIVNAFLRCCCCGGFKGKSDAFYFCGCRVYDEEDFGTRDGCLNCLMSQGGRTWLLLFSCVFYAVIQGCIMYSLDKEAFDNGNFTVNNGTGILGAIYFVFMTDASIGYGDVTITPGNHAARIALFLLTHGGLLIMGLSAGSTANAVMNCLDNDSRTGNFFIDLPLKFIRNHKFFFFVGIYLLLVFVGAALFMWLPNIETDGEFTYWDYSDAFYYCWVTLSTVGYGDFVHKSLSGRFLSVVYATVGIGFLGLIMNKASTYLEEKFDKILRKRLKHKGQSRSGQEIDVICDRVLELLSEEFRDVGDRMDIIARVQDRLQEEKDNRDNDVMLVNLRNPSDAYQKSKKAQRQEQAFERQFNQIVDDTAYVKFEDGP